MISQKRQTTSNFRAGNLSRIVVAAVFTWSSVVYPVMAQTPDAPAQPPPDAVPAPPPPPAAAAPPAAPVPVYSMTDLQYLLEPIALYPDPLLALILPAATFPDQLIEADEWIIANAAAVKRRDFRAADAKNWDPNVQALTRFPDVVALLTEHIDWTESLGTAAALQPDDVAAAIQLLRAKAESVGNLTSTPQQVVTTRVEQNTRTIYIAPANPERIYVPVYDSSTVFTTAAVGALAFGAGVLVGSSWNNRWGWNNRRWNNVWVRHYWAPPPPRPPHHGRPGTPPSGPWRPDRPGQRPERPSNRPDRPSNRPDRPGVRPERPGPDRPGTRPERPGVRPERPSTRPERPSARPERPAARPDRPATRPERPTASPERPAARPQTPTSRPQTRPQQTRPPARPQQTRPPARPQQTRPTTRPQQTRPQQPRPRPEARPSRPANPPSRPQRPRPGERR
ncbi:MAG: DUF3300 domain-containing protein [Xanthobacteraceae bacterium]